VQVSSLSFDYPTGKSHPKPVVEGLPHFWQNQAPIRFSLLCCRPFFFVQFGDAFAIKSVYFSLIK
jgi:hypothetical protein